MPAESEPPRHSKAFERFVQDHDDLAGLIAYAFYKQAIREALSQGGTVHRSQDRAPTPTEVDAYRNAAESKLTAFAESMIEQSKADIADTAARADIKALKSDLTTTIKQATTWRTAIATNLVAWLLSIAITVLILLSGAPSWISTLIASLKTTR